MNDPIAELIRKVLDLFVALKVNLGSRNSPLMLGTL